MRCPVAFVLLALTALARPAAAQTVPVRRVFEAGTEAFRAGRYDTAAIAYEEAYRQAPLPDFAFSAAQAHRRQYFVDHDAARLHRARELYEAYLAAVSEGGRRADAVTHLQTIATVLAQAPTEEPTPSPTAPTTRLMVVSRATGARASIDGDALAPVPLVRDVAVGAHRVRVAAPGYFSAEESWIAVEGHLVVADLEPTARPARLSLRAPTGTRFEIDGRPAGAAPLAKALVLLPGRHRVAAALPGHVPVTELVDLPRGAGLSVALTLPESSQRRAARWVLAGSAVPVVAAIVTGALAVAADARAVDLDQQRDTGTLDPAGAARYEDELSLRNDLRTTTIVLGAAAVAIAATGLVLYLADTPVPADAHR